MSRLPETPVADRPSMRRRLRTRLAVMTAVAGAVAVLSTGVAAAAFTAGSAAGQAVAASSLPAPAAPSVSPPGSTAPATVSLAFSAVTLAGTDRPATGYAYRATSGPTTLTGTCTDPAACQVAGLDAGTWTFAVRATYAGWTGPFGAASNAVTITPVTGPLVITGVFASGGNVKVGFDGTGAAAGTPIRVEICPKNESDCANPWVSTVQSPSAGTWRSGQNSGNNLKPGDPYVAVATQGSRTSEVFAFFAPNK